MASVLWLPLAELVFLEFLLKAQHAEIKRFFLKLDTLVC